jgi:hypothetical protein
MLSDEVASVFSKYHLIKAESGQLIVVCKRTLRLIHIKPTEYGGVQCICTPENRVRSSYTCLGLFPQWYWYF